MVVTVDGVFLLPTPCCASDSFDDVVVAHYLSVNHQVYATIFRFSHNLRDNVVKEVLHRSLASESQTVWLNHH